MAGSLFISALLTIAAIKGSGTTPLKEMEKIVSPGSTTK